MMASTIHGLSASVKDAECERSRPTEDVAFAAMLTPPPTPTSTSTSTPTESMSSERGERMSSVDSEPPASREADGGADAKGEAIDTEDERPAKAGNQESSTTTSAKTNGVDPQRLTEIGAQRRHLPTERLVSQKRIGRADNPSIEGAKKGLGQSTGESRADVPTEILARMSRLGVLGATSGTGTAGPVAEAIVTRGASVTSSSSLSGAATPIGALMGSFTAPSLSSASVQAASFSVPIPVGAEHWAADLGDRILTAVRAEMGEAVINLAPEELGPVKVSLNVQDGEVRLKWIASASETRLALEQALPRLRELFAQQGLQLLEHQVLSGASQHSMANDSKNTNEFARSSSPSVAHRDMSTDEPAPVDSRVATSQSRGLLDIYA